MGTPWSENKKATDEFLLSGETSVALGSRPYFRRRRADLNRRMRVLQVVIQVFDGPSFDFGQIPTKGLGFAVSVFSWRTSSAFGWASQ